MRRALALSLALALSPWAAHAQDEASLTGHYYLQGVREVGSELLLREDHRFEWMLAYGALDQLAQGRWQRVGDRVVLTPDRPDAHAPLLRYAGSHAWSAEDERRLAERDADAQRHAALARCPFLEDEAYASSALPIGDTVPREQRLREAEQAATTLQRAIDAFEQRAAAAMATGPGQADAVAAARAARDAYEIAWMALQSARRQAGLPDVDRPEPHLPPQCAMSDPFAGPPSSNGRERLAVHVSDPELGLEPSDLRVRFEFASGAPLELRTEQGWAGAHETRVAHAVSIGWPASDGRPAHTQRFELPPAAVHEITLDARPMLPVPFERMELRIDGEDLVPAEPFDQGRYHRD